MLNDVPAIYFCLMLGKLYFFVFTISIAFGLLSVLLEILLSQQRYDLLLLVVYYIAFTLMAFRLSLERSIPFFSYPSLLFRF